MKKFFSMLLALVMLLALAGCGGDKTPAQDQGGSSDAGQTQQGGDSGEADGAAASLEDGIGDYHIGIVTGSVSQSEDARRIRSPWPSIPTTSPRSWRPRSRPSSTCPTTP